MLFTSVILVALSVTTTLDGATAPAAPLTPRWEVAPSVASGTAAALPGLTVGGDVQLARRLRGGPLFISVQGSVASASAATATFTIDHRQLVLALGVGLRASLGVGEVWLQAGAGALGLWEDLGRHQLERLEMAGVPGGKQSSFALGPYAFAEVGITVRVWGALGARIGGGPVLWRIPLAEGARARFGALAKIGAAYEF